MSDLKPCPFCGAVPALRDRPADKCEASSTGRIWSITCYGDATNAHAWFYGDTRDAVVSGWNGRADDYRSAVAAYPKEPRTLVSEVLYARGSLSRDTRRAVVTMLKDLQVIVDVARDPDGVLAVRQGPTPQPADERSR